MTARYAPAAFLAALLHVAVIAVLVLFAVATRNEPSALPKLSGQIFDLVNGSATPTQMPERGVQVNIPPRPKVVVEEEPRPVVDNPPVVQPRALVQPKPQPRSVVKPPGNPAPTVKPSRPVSQPVAPARVDTKWGDAMLSPTQSDIPSTDAGAPQATPELESYMDELCARLKAALQVPPGVRPDLMAKAEFVLRADGVLVEPRIVRSSGSAEFDRAVVQAISRTRMRARPDGKTVKLTFPFATELK